MSEEFVSLETDKKFMAQAIELAKNGSGFTNPNPLVGAVIVRNGKIVAQGYHHRYGDLHAERDALKNARENGVDVKGATVFVTLEPCCHYGKQPPCTQALVEAGIKKVVIGSRDPNPLVNGKGIKILESAGIQVVQDFMRCECDALNPIFFHYVKQKIPYVILKYAETADGETATSAGKSKWITGELARKNVHKTRARVAAVMTGIGTVKADNPMLNVRLEEKSADGRDFKQPVRVVIDKNLELGEESNLAKTAAEIPVWDFCDENLDEKAKSRKVNLERLGVKFFKTKLNQNHLDLEEVLKTLGANGIDSVLVESGGGLNAGLLFYGDEKKCLADEIQVYIAPKIFGNNGKSVFSSVKGEGILEVENCVKLSRPEIQTFGDDILLRYKTERTR